MCTFKQSWSNCGLIDQCLRSGSVENLENYYCLGRGQFGSHNNRIDPPKEQLQFSS
jgi:hypothetical protein